MDRHTFLFLPSHCAVFEIDPGMEAVLDRCRGLGAFTRESALSGFWGQVEEASDFFEELVSRCVIVSEATIAQDHRKSHAYPEMPVHTLVLQVTDACNLGCDYCYCRNNPTPPHSEKKMTKATARRAVDFLFSRSGNQKALTLVFFGGEPLLNFDLISDAVDYAREKGFHQNKQIDFAVTTNATLLTRPIIEFLAEKQISVTVSMDGGEDIHDRHRRFLNGDPSYQVIVPKIKKLLQQMAKRPVAARVTVTEGAAEDVPKTLLHLLDVGFAEAGFAPATTCDLRFQLQEAGMVNLLRHFKRLCDQFLDLAKEDKVLGFTNLIDLLVLIHQGEIKKYPCGAGSGLFCVDTGGDLYLCQRLAGNSAAHMGDIEQGVDARKAAAFREKVQTDREPLCPSCWVRHICAGGCYQEALVREGTLTAPNRHYCRWIREWTGIGLTVYAKLAIDRPDYLDRLARLRGH